MDYFLFYLLLTLASLLKSQDNWEQKQDEDQITFTALLLWNPGLLAYSLGRSSSALCHFHHI